MSDEMITLEPVESRKNGMERKLILFCVLIILFAGSLAFFTIAPRLENAALVANGGVGNGVLQEQINALNARLQAVETKITGEAAAPATAAPETNAADAARITRMQGDMDSLSAAMSAMQTEMKAKEAMAAQARDASVGMMAEVVAFLPLREAINTGHAFDAQLAGIRSVASKDPELQSALVRLEPFANSGVPTSTMLHDEIAARESSVNTAMAKGAAQTFWQRIVAQLQSLITVHSSHDVTNDALAGVEIALSKGNAAAALEAFKTLPQDAQQSLADWQKQLMARVETDQILGTITTHFTQQPAPSEVKAP